MLSPDGPVGCQGASDNRVLVGNVNAAGTTFSGWQTLLHRHTTSAAPGIAWNSITSKLDVVCKGNASNNVFKAAINGDSTTGLVAAWTQVAGAVSTSVPAAGMNPLLAPLNIFTLNARQRFGIRNRLVSKELTPPNHPPPLKGDGAGWG